MTSGNLWASFVRAGSIAGLTLLYGLTGYSFYRRFSDTGSMNALAVVIINTIFVAMFIFRRDAKSLSTSPALWLIALAGTCLPLLLRSTQAAPFTSVGNGIQLLGTLGVGAAILSLRTSFGIVPANRGIRTHGLYHFVRHPLYAFELLALGGFVLSNPSLWNVGLWLTEFALQFTRARAEERLLGDDPTYADYRSRVKYRLIPGVV